MNLDDFLVRRHRQQVERCSERSRWDAVAPEVAGDEWWVDVTLPMLESMRRRLRGLVRFVEKTKQSPVYTDFEDTLEDSEVIDLPGVTTGMNWDRFRAKAQAYLKEHEDHVALQRLRRNKQLTAEDLDSLAAMHVASGGDQQVDLAWVRERAGEFGPFIRSLVGSTARRPLRHSATTSTRRSSPSHRSASSR